MGHGAAAAPLQGGIEDVRAFLKKLPEWFDGGERGDGTGVRIEFWGGEPFVYWKALKVLGSALRSAYPTLDNVGREIAKHLDAAAVSQERIEVTYRPYLSTDIEGPQMDPPMTMTLSEVEVDVFTEEAAEALLHRDVAISERAVLRLISVPLADGQFDALISFTFNLGAGALQRSTLRRKVNREEHAEVPGEFRKWVWAGGKRLPGLVKRRNAEAGLYNRSPS